VRLGFEVDKQVPVHRFEVWQRIHAASEPERPTDSRGPPVAK
jgi:hypothetical protein